jgi:hypothetical protein
MTPEGLIKKQIMDWLSAHPRKVCRVWPIQIGRIPGRTNHSKGIADILGLWHGRGLAIEVKAKGGKPSKEQKEFLQDWKESGGIAILAYSLDDVIDALRVER